MGKILATLRQIRPSPNGDRRPQKEDAASAIGELPPEQDTLDGEALPYIEIGPQRQIEASPDVLATAPKQPPIPSPASAPRPPRVVFRNLPGSAGSELPPELVAYHRAGEPEAAPYSELLTALLEAARKRARASQALLFTAARSEVGCTTALLNVAITAALAGRKVVVVDANLRRPEVARKLGLTDAPGLAEVLAGECSSIAALRETAVERLSALSAGTPAPFLAELSALHTLVEELRGGFDLVFIDGPPWDGRAGCKALAEASDAVFLVVDSREADSPPASDLLRELPAQGIPLAGCILTNP
jgi:Mrp family chromosome partitioning ATPase